MGKHVVKIVLVSKFGVQHLEEEADSLTRSVDPRASLSPLVQAYQVTQSTKTPYNLTCWWEPLTCGVLFTYGPVCPSDSPEHYVQ